MSTQAPVEVNLQDPNNFTTTNIQYEYNYATSSTVVTKRNTYLEFDFDSKDAEIKLGEVPYKVQEIRLYRGSLTKYEGADVAAEMIIHHVEPQGGKNLLVHIPIVSTTNNVKSTSNEYLKNVLKNVPSDSDSNNEKNDINQILELNHFINERPFFLSSTTLPYPPNNGDNYTIFFSPSEHAILIDTSVQATINELLDNPSVSHTSLDNSLIRYNANSSINLSKSDPNSDDIYIDCSPTGDTVIPLDELQKQAGMQPDLPFTERIQKFFQDNPVVREVLIFIGSIIGLIISYYIFKYSRIVYKGLVGTAEAEERAENSSDGNT